jgi:hypothetical protein
VHLITAAVDLDEARHVREDWAFFRDRRPDLYGPLLSLDGSAGARDALAGAGDGAVGERDASLGLGRGHRG